MTAPRSATVTFAIVLVAVAAVGAMVGVTLGRRSARVSGGVIAEGASVGTFSFNTSACASGQGLTPGFFGAELRGTGGYVLRVAGSGPVARLWLYGRSPMQPALTIGQPSCAEWDVLVEGADTVVNGVNTVSGHVNVTCAVGGGKVTAHVTFERCAR